MEAFTEAQRVGEALVAAGARHAQGWMANSRGNDDEARRLIQEGLGLLPAAAGSDSSLWATTIGLVVDPDAHGRPRMYFEDTLVLFRRIGPEAARGYMLCDLALVARAQGKHLLAREALDRALTLQRERGDPPARRSRSTPSAISRAHASNSSSVASGSRRRSRSGVRWATAAPPG